MRGQHAAAELAGVDGGMRASAASPQVRSAAVTHSSVLRTLVKNIYGKFETHVLPSPAPALRVPIDLPHASCVLCRRGMPTGGPPAGARLPPGPPFTATNHAPHTPLPAHPAPTPTTRTPSGGAAGPSLTAGAGTPRSPQAAPPAPPPPGAARSRGRGRAGQGQPPCCTGTDGPAGQPRRTGGVFGRRKLASSIPRG